MVFVVPLHNNMEIPLYFLRKKYAEFVLVKYINYFDMLEFHVVGRRMPQNRLNVRIEDLNRLVPPPRTTSPKLDVPSAHQVIPKT